MTSSRHAGSTEAGSPPLSMTLYVAGDRPNSLKAQANLRAMCEEDLPGGVEAEVVNVLKDFARAAAEGIVVTPTLIIDQGRTPMVVIGCLSDRDKVLTALRIESEQ